MQEFKDKIAKRDALLAREEKNRLKEEVIIAYVELLQIFMYPTIYEYIHVKAFMYLFIQMSMCVYIRIYS